MRRFLDRPAAVVLAIVLGVTLAAPSLKNGLQTEDFMHAFAAKNSSMPRLFGVPGNSVFRNYQGKDAGTVPWITVADFRLALFRPLTGLTHRLDHLLWPSHPALMHAHNLLWFALLLGGAGLLFRRRVEPRWAAGLAAVLYALNDAHTVAVGWLANRNALLAAALSVLGLVAYDRWRSDAWRPGAVIGPLLWTLGLLGGELALGAMGYLVAHLIFLDRAPLPRRLVQGLPWLFVLVAWAVTYRALGYGSHGSGIYLDPFDAPREFLTALVLRFPFLITGAYGIAVDPWLLFPQSWAFGIVAGLLVFIAIVGALLAPLLRREPEARFWALGSVLSCLPVIGTAPSDRLLFLPALGAMALIATLVARLVERAASVPRSSVWRVPATVAAVAWLIRYTLIAPLFQPLRATVMTPLTRFFEQAGESAFGGLSSPKQQVIIVNLPDFLSGGLIAGIRSVQGRPMPERFRMLYGGIDAVNVSRPNSHALLLRPERGFLAHPMNTFFRGTSYPMRVGEGLSLKDLLITVTAVDARGAPTEALFRFSQPLESPQFRFISWDGKRYVPFELPAVGERVVIPTLRLPVDGAG